MRDLSLRNAAFVRIDESNSQDPNQIAGRPRALVQGELASAWAERLVDTPDDSVAVACRAHHLERWVIERSSYPEGRAGYLRWRRDNKAHQARKTLELLDGIYDEPTLQRIADLLLRKGLGADPEVQVVEDAACLVFLDTQFDDMVERLDHEHLVGVVAKTLKKMSASAIELAGEVSLSARATEVLSDAISQEAES